MSRLQQDIEKAEKSSRSKILFVLFFLFCVFSGIAGGALYWTFSDLPAVNAIEEYVPMESSKVYSADGKILAEFYYERRTFVPYYKIPDRVKKAFVAIEGLISSARCGLLSMISGRGAWPRAGAQLPSNSQKCSSSSRRNP
jgi:membrane peptidoglycan carboxypeptidase